MSLQTPGATGPRRQPDPINSFARWGKESIGYAEQLPALQGLSVHFVEGYVTVKCGNLPKAIAKTACPESLW